jgi:hypothetical protein
LANMKPLEEGRSENDIEVFKVVNEWLKTDVQLFWTRANFYLVVQAGMFSVAISLLSRASNTADKLLVLAVGLVGLVLAVFWVIVMQAAFRRIHAWREAVIELDKKVDRFQSIDKVEKIFKNKPFLWSTSNVTRFLPIPFLVSWMELIWIVLVLIVLGTL